jgi:hypothetical protein
MPDENPEPLTEEQKAARLVELYAKKAQYEQEIPGAPPGERAALVDWLAAVVAEIAQLEGT